MSTLHTELYESFLKENNRPTPFFYSQFRLDVSLLVYLSFFSKKNIDLYSAVTLNKRGKKKGTRDI